MNEKISVIMAVYNCANYLPEAIESIIAQSYSNWELIICDDASQDQTFSVAQHYKTLYPDKIILIRNEKNMKLSYSLNRCLELATGDYIARMDGDDKCLPERFECEMSYLRSHPDYDIVGTAMQRFNDKGLGPITESIQNPDYYTLRRSNPFHHATILAHKYVYERLSGYTVLPRTERGQDYDLWFRFFHAGFQGNNLSEPLYLVREDENAVRRRTIKSRIRTIETMIIGFRLLGYPWWWAIRPIVLTVVKCLVPYRVVDWYRLVQSHNK